MTLEGTAKDFDTVTATGDGVTLDGSTQLNLTGTGNTIGLASGDSLGVSGGGNTLNVGADEQVVLGNTGKDFDTVDATGDASGQAVADGEYSGVILGDNAQANLNGNGNFVGLASGDSFGAYGGGNTLSVGADEQVVIGDTNKNFDTINATGDVSGQTVADGEYSGVILTDNTQANLNGNGNFVGLASGDSFGAYGGGNTLNAGADEQVVIGNTSNTLNVGADEQVVIGNTGSDFDTVNVNGDVGGQAVADGQGSGIVLNTDSQANIDGSDNTIAETTGDSMSVDGGGNTIDTGAGELLWVGDTGSDTDTINANDNVVGGETANGQGTGIWFEASSDAVVDGSGDQVTLQASDDISLDGSNNILDGSSSDAVNLDGTGDSIDLSDAMIDLSSDDDVTITGSDDKIFGGNGDTFTVTGGGDYVDADDSTIDFDGSDSGDSIAGSGDDGSYDGSSASGGDGGGYSGGGYDGYGFTSWKGKTPAASIANRYAGKTGTVYENAAWADKTLTWSFAVPKSGSGALLSDAISDPSQQAAVEQAFQTWAQASGLNLMQVASGQSADIEVGYGDLDTATTNQIGLTHYQGANGVATGALVELEDPSQSPLTTNSAGQLAYANTDATFEQVALHEIGHALGLGDSDQAGSIMNYLMDGSNTSLGTTDVAGIHSLYAADSGASVASAADAGSQQLSQLVQAMATFGGEGMGETGMGSADMDLYKPPLAVALHARAA